MTLLVIALKKEAIALIEFYQLKKLPHKAFEIYVNEKLLLIISGLGQLKAAAAVGFALAHSKIDLLVNIGLAAGSKEQFTIGELVLANQITQASTQQSVYSDILIQHNLREAGLITFDLVQTKALQQLKMADMESYGIFIAAKHCLNNNEIFSLKIISDYFEPEKFDKTITKKLINNQLKSIDKFINQALTQVSTQLNYFDDKQKMAINLIAKQLKLSKNLELELEKLFITAIYGLEKLDSISQAQVFLAQQTIKSKASSKATFAALKTFLLDT